MEGLELINFFLQTDLAIHMLQRNNILMHTIGNILCLQENLVTLKP